MSVSAAILGRKRAVRLKAKAKDEVATSEREFKFRKRMGFSVLGSLITLPLDSTSAVNNLGSNGLFRKMCDLINKVIYHHVFIISFIKSILKSLVILAI